MAEVLGHCSKTRQDAAKMAIFEHRSGADMKYASTAAQKKRHLQPAITSFRTSS
jgi:hypothetical protein